MSTPASAGILGGRVAPQVRAEVARWLQTHAAARADLRVDSRQVRRGDVFVALPGRHADGLEFLGAAAERGAAAALVDEASWRKRGGAAPAAVAILPVADLQACAGVFAADHYGDPGAHLRTVAITGTNGKTSSCQWVAQVLGDCGRRCATLGTLGYGFPGALEPEENPLTTPDAVNLQRLARRALDEGARALAIEVSSIGLEQGRVDAFPFHVALFTNLTRDHLDYHADMQAYATAKRRLFDWPTLEAVVLNLDDAFGRGVATELGARRAAGASPRIIGYGSAPDAPVAVHDYLHAEGVAHRESGLRMTAVARSRAAQAHAEIDTGLIGGFNVANLLGVIGAALACGIEWEAAAAAAGRLRAPAGRMQQVQAAGPDGAAGGRPMVVVDYAHTPDAISQALQALRPLARARGGRLCIVFGAGGDRDPGKRPLMAQAAAALADRVLLTSDNPRGEAPEAIIDQLEAGMPPGAVVRREADRGRAIALALGEAGPNDVVLIAGKGHEPYQEIAGRRLPFSDVEAARAALQSWEPRP